MKLRNLRVQAILGIAMSALAANAQVIVISGRVESEAGAPLSGASVFAARLQAGTLSNENGNYLFSVPMDRTDGKTLS